MMNVKFLTCKFYQRQIDAYLDKTLNMRARRRLARHIDECPSCYRAYAQRRDLRRDLESAVSLVGRHHEPDFDRMWGTIRAELPQPRYQTQFRYGLVGLMLLLALLVPFTMGNRDLARHVPDQPKPHTDPATETPVASQLVAAATEVAPATQAQDLVLETPPTLPEPGR
jgi:anti-sigma factor RsiW